MQYILKQCMEKFKKNRRRITVTFFAFLTAFLLGNLFGMISDAKEIPEHFVRFHIIANSDSVADQTVKQQVRQRIFERLDLSGISSRETALEYFEQNKYFVKMIANQVLAENGFSYQSQVTVGKKLFPIREYSDFVLPAGNYDAVTVTLGNGEGQNFFCVMYPSLCMIEGVCEKTTSNADILQHVLSEKEIRTITGEKKTVIAKFKIAELVENFLEK